MRAFNFPTRANPIKESFLDSLFEMFIRRLVAKVGVGINDERYPRNVWVHDPRLWRRVVLGGGFEEFGEAYQYSMWDCDDVADLICRLRRLKHPTFQKISQLPRRVTEILVNLQDMTRAKKNVADHYDLGNRFYEAFLDPSMQYSCAYFERAAGTLKDAQRDKMQLIGEKLLLKPGMRVLDIGCGWGGLAAHLAVHFRVKVVGITLSVEQLAGARSRHKKLIKEGLVEFHLMDYRAARTNLGQFDCVVSVGMAEHVGKKNFDEYLDSAYDCLTRDGVFLMHTIVGRVWKTPPWIGTYIFPGGSLPHVPTLKLMLNRPERCFHIWDEHYFGRNYARTCREWRMRMLAHWDYIRQDVPAHPLNPFPRGTRAHEEWFKRTQVFYLSSSEGGFLEGGIDLMQMLLAKNPRPKEYVAPR